MPNTSVHLPQALLASLDRIAAELGTSRNRLIAESCQRAVDELPRWPPELFSNIRHFERIDDLDIVDWSGPGRRGTSPGRPRRA